jgi:tetratricopeptide (TPR) repeat protein
MAPAEGPEPSVTVKESSKKSPSQQKKAQSPKQNPKPAATPLKQEKTEAPKQPPAPVANTQPSPAVQQPTIEIASIRSTPPPMPPSSDDMESAVRDRMIADFKEETLAVFSQVGDATDHFRSADKLESVPKLPAPVSESVTALSQRARDFRAKVGYETALLDFRTETETVDALSTINQVTRNIAANDASSANARLADFLKSNPEPSAENQAPLWLYLKAMQQLCSRSERDARVHLERGESLAAASRTSEAIREYQEAYRIFPNPATAEKIRQLQANSLGL